MKAKDYTTSFTVDKSPEEVFAVINDVRSWWTGDPGIEGSTGKLGDEFTYTYKPWHFSKQRISEFIPSKKVVWDVLDSNLSFVEDKAEWKGTKIIFDISKKAQKTEVRFTHVGLIPEVECYDDCSNGWNSYINGSLQNFFKKSKAEPNDSNF